MLTRTGKTATELGIEPHEHRALWDVLHRMESGQFVWADPFDEPSGPLENGFNMTAFSSSIHDCRTIHCIGGWCDKLHGTFFAHKYEDYRTPPALKALFTGPSMLNGTRGSCTVEQAAAKLREYLETGQCRQGWLTEEEQKVRDELVGRGILGFGRRVTHTT